MADPREQLARELLGCGYDEVTPVQRSVIDLIANEAPTGVDPQLKHDERTFGQRLADRVADIGGSWAFIGGFSLCPGAVDRAELLRLKNAAPGLRPLSVHLP
jgi:hypothetical protein